MGKQCTLRLGKLSKRTIAPIGNIGVKIMAKTSGSVKHLRSTLELLITVNFSPISPLYYSEYELKI